jgi:hypothetical protein
MAPESSPVNAEFSNPIGLARKRGVKKRNHFVSQVNVALEMALQVLHALFRYQILLHVIARHILTQTGEADCNEAVDGKFFRVLIAGT